MISVVIPTYNEKENIKRLIPAIFRHVRNAEVIVVDDNSPDGTASEVKKLSKKFNVKLLSRKRKLGIGSAYKEGFKIAKGEIVFEMDADFSHNPKFLKNFLKKIDSGYDVVIGSRYIKGGKIFGWGVCRKLVSKTANLLASFLLGMPMKDVTTGYRAYRKKIFKEINFNSIKSDGYAFQLEILHKFYESGAKISEIPVTFVGRKIGKSKLGTVEILNFISTVFRLMLS